LSVWLISDKIRLRKAGMVCLPIRASKFWQFNGGHA
jgi:hypothetical protein